MIKKINAGKLLKDLKTKPEGFWIRRGEQMALKLFKDMSLRVPAYKDFLRKHKINPDKINSASDLDFVPPVDKNSYLKAYPLEKLCWDGEFNKKRWVFSSTSGTTGEPFYFPREDAQDWQYALTAELYMLNNFDIADKSVLYIDGFAMGAWIGGLFTYQAVKNLSENGRYKMSIITPGVNKSEIIKTVKKMAPLYDMVIFGGYPPFVKDTIDEGLESGLDWKKYNIRFIFSAEAFTESFRDYIAEKAGLKNIYKDTLNHYGTVDLGTMSHETPLTVLLRKMALKDGVLAETIFGRKNRQPTLTQFFPEMFFFQEVNKNLLCSAYSGLPLVRYDLKDIGGVIRLEDFKKGFSDLDKHLNKAKIADTVMNLPFVYVFERSDMVISWYGANIYPEHIREAHEHPEISKFVSGRFAMQIANDKMHNPVIQIFSELKKNKKADRNLLKRLENVILEKLLEKNSEFKSAHNSVHASKRRFDIQLVQNQGHAYFTSGGKQKWIIK